MEEVIIFKNVSKIYGKEDHAFYALKKINFSLTKGEFVVILGPSGAGKSTLLNLLGGMDSLSEGNIIVNNIDISDYNEQDLNTYRAEKVGFVFQFYNLIPSLTAYENVAIVNDIKKQNTDIHRVLNAVQLTRQSEQFPAQLSGGEQQRVSIARAIAKDPLLLLCDEPTGALDSNTGVEILELLKQQCVEGKTVIVVTHNALIAEVADRVLHIKNGEIEKNEMNKHPKKICEVTW